jgi:hypothetical protein
MLSKSGPHFPFRARGDSQPVFIVEHHLAEQLQPNSNPDVSAHASPGIPDDEQVADTQVPTGKKTPCQ